MGSLLALCTGRLYYAPGAAAMDRPMRDRIRQRLEEYRAEAHERIGVAVNMTRSKHAVNGTLSSSMCYLAINKDNETGFAEYMDRSAAFIRHIAHFVVRRLERRYGKSAVRAAYERFCCETEAAA
jgi:hypothetical protein